MSRLKILHIIDSLQKGGAEKLLVDYLSETQKSDAGKEVEQYICTLHHLKDEFPIPDGIKRITIDFNKWNFAVSIFRLNQFIKRNNISIVHAHLVDSILMSRFLTSSTIKKKIFTYHNLYFDKKFVYFSKWRTFLEKWSYKSYYISIYVSKQIQECVEAVRGGNKHDFILNNFPNPSFTYKYKVKDTSDLKAVIVANLRETKNLDLALEEINRIKDYPVHIDIYGDGPLRKTLQDKILQQKLNISLKGSQIISPDLLSEYDLFLLTSESEGLPIALLEAMATGLPALLPDHLPVFKEVASDSAIFYSIRKPGDLAARFREILSDKQQLNILSIRANEKAKLYDVGKYVAQLLKTYRQKNLLYVIDTLEVGGAEELLVNTVNEISRQEEFKIHVATTRRPNGKLKNKLSSKVTYVHFNGYGFKYLAAVLQLKKYIKNNLISLVHSHLEHSMILARLASAKHVKMISTYHNMEYDPGNSYYSQWRVWLEKITHRARYISIYVSKSVKETVEKVRKSKEGFGYVLSNFSDTTITHGYSLKTSASLRVVTIANLKKSKNLELPIEVMADLKEYPISWDIIGEGMLRSRLEERIRVKKSEVRLLGNLDVNNKVLEEYDVFVLTSFDEGMPIALLEAINFGLPCILPDHLNVMREVAEDAAMYFSVQHKEQLQKMLISLLKDKSRLSTMSDAALQRRQLFLKEVHINELLEVYRR